MFLFFLFLPRNPPIFRTAAPAAPPAAPTWPSRAAPGPAPTWRRRAPRAARAAPSASAARRARPGPAAAPRGPPLAATKSRVLCPQERRSTRMAMSSPARATPGESGLFFFLSNLLSKKNALLRRRLLPIASALSHLFPRPLITIPLSLNLLPSRCPGGVYCVSGCAPAVPCGPGLTTFGATGQTSSAACQPIDPCLSPNTCCQGSAVYPPWSASTPACAGLTTPSPTCNNLAIDAANCGRWDKTSLFLFDLLVLLEKKETHSLTSAPSEPNPKTKTRKQLRCRVPGLDAIRAERVLLGGLQGPQQRRQQLRDLRKRVQPQLRGGKLQSVHGKDEKKGG